MKKLFLAFVIIFVVCSLVGSVVLAQSYLHYYHPYMSFSDVKYTNSVAGYPEGTSTDDISYTHTNTTCDISEAKLWSTAQYYGFLGWYNLPYTYVTPGNTGGVVWGEGDNTTYAGYRYKLQAKDNYRYDGTRAPIVIPNTKFVINYYDYPDP